MTRTFAAILSIFCLGCAVIVASLPYTHDVTVTSRVKGVLGFTLFGLYFLTIYRRLPKVMTIMGNVVFEDEKKRISDIIAAKTEFVSFQKALGADYHLKFGGKGYSLRSGSCAVYDFSGPSVFLRVEVKDGLPFRFELQPNEN